MDVSKPWCIGVIEMLRQQPTTDLENHPRDAADISDLELHFPAVASWSLGPPWECGFSQDPYGEYLTVTSMSSDHFPRPAKHFHVFNITTQYHVKQRPTIAYHILTDTLFLHVKINH